jgi:hypothetical protein
VLLVLGAFTGGLETLRNAGSLRFCVISWSTVAPVEEGGGSERTMLPSEGTVLTTPLEAGGLA